MDEGIHGKQGEILSDFLMGGTNSKGGFFDGQGWKSAQEGEKGDWQHALEEIGFREEEGR